MVSLLKKINHEICSYIYEIHHVKLGNSGRKTKMTIGFRSSAIPSSKSLDMSIQPRVTAESKEVREWGWQIAECK